MTVRTRITLLIVGTGFVSSLLFSAVVFYELIEQPFELLDSVLKEEAYRATEMVVLAQEKADFRALEARSRTADRFWIEVYDPDRGQLRFQSLLAKSARLPAIDPGSSAIARPVQSGEETSRIKSRIEKTAFRVRAFSISSGGQSFIVQIARPIEKLKEEIRDLVFGILAGLVLSTLALVVLSRVVAGRILYPIGKMKTLAQDISEKNLEQRIPAGEGQDEFSELARTINRMLDRLQYSFQRQRDFLFDTSHELKTPLTTMRLLVDEICVQHLETLPSNTEESLSRLKNQVLRMERLVKDLLNLSSLEALTRIDRIPLQINTLLSSLAEEYRFLADAHNITMGLHLAKNLIVPGDSEKLRRAFSNILDNAVKYNVDGGRIELRTDQSPTELTVTVENTGPGVATSEIPRVFDQFYRVEKSRSVLHGGAGLGLSIVKQIIALHNGNVAFESELGGWTRVIVTLPLALETLPASTPSRKANGFVASGRQAPDP